MLVLPKTPNALQKNWKASTEFPACPSTHADDPINSYYENLKEGEVFSKTEYSLDSKSEFIVFNAAIHKGSIIVLCENTEWAIKPYSLAKITYSDGKFIHESIATFFTEEGAIKQFTLLQGLEWKGGDSIDDYS